jgi:hypothetical protein
MAGLRRFTSIASAACLLLGAAAASAQAGDKASAEALFDQGVKLINFNDACPKLEESERFDPAVGTLLYLGECFERVGRTASAWATFREAASLANNSGQADRARIASNRAAEIEPKLSRLSVELSPDVAKIPGVVVKRGNQRVDPSLYGTPLPVDPGDYRVDVTAPGYDNWSTPITVAGNGASASVRVPALLKSAEPPVSAAPSSPPPTGAPAAPPTPSQQPPSPPPKLSLTTQQTLGLVIGGVGIVGAGLGAYFGIAAISKNSDAETHCPKKGFCVDDAGIELTHQAQRDARASNIAFAVGGVLLATGAVLYLTGKRGTSDGVALLPVLTQSSAAASLAGRF